ncbi:MAG: hypothetical protein QF907_08620 [Nitrospinota bacterium]|jgi:hypothetical protein|nr:hypothetical protein [Nitrospinota bacterium]MDP7555462.1 hypothetical protein [Nitrospinota bacterium]MDP7581207.1 hypothetical protein [Nitrospinota bacterium]HJN01921.1 hypothetical protein [Nitrospinota bacterium]|tara:strand:- start:3562 stop:3705 length:144 start_codon:yes stop_codon:yes gene_type:complete
MVDEKELQEIIDSYNALVKGLHEKAKNNEKGRACGGIIGAVCHSNLS